MACMKFVGSAALAAIAMLAVLSVPNPLRAAVDDYFAGGVNPYRPDVSGNTYIITGPNTGIGYETARELLQLGGTVS